MQYTEHQKLTCFEINILACPSSPRAEATKAVKNIGTRGDMMELVWKKGIFERRPKKRKKLLQGDQNFSKLSLVKIAPDKDLIIIMH